MSASRRVVAVFGSTGQQGGAVFRALSNSNEFRVRAITRDPQSAAAKKLLANDKADNVEVVAGDLYDNQSLQNALSGVWGAFVLTHFFDPQVKDFDEEKLVKNIADQALKAGVKFFVYSSLPDASTLSGGRHEVPHFTKKNKAEQYIRALPFIDGVVFPYAGSFASNFLTMASPKKNATDGVYEFYNVIRNDVALPIVDLEEEYSSTVLEIFLHPKKYTGQSIFTGNYLTLPQWAEAFTKAIGKPARYIQLPSEAGKAFGEALNQTFQYFNNFGYYGGAAIHPIAHVKTTDPVAFWKRHAQQF